MRLLSSSVLAAVLLAACGTSGATPGASSGSSDGTGDPVLVIAEGGVDGTGMRVGEALGHQATDDLVTVTGALFVDPDGTVRLCDAMAESFPPQCAGDRIAVRGLALDALQLQEANGVRWMDSVSLFGSVE